MIGLRVENLDDAIRGKVVCTYDLGCVHICHAVCHGNGNVFTQERLECALIRKARGVRHCPIDESVLSNVPDCLG